MAHKWILAPTGNGILYIKNSFQAKIYATVLDGGVDVYTRTVGTRPAHSILGLGHVIDYLNSYGREKIVSHNLILAKNAWHEFNKDSKLIITDTTLDEKEYKLLVGNSSKAKKNLNWTPKTSLNKLVKLMIKEEKRFISIIKLKLITKSKITY